MITPVDMHGAMCDFLEKEVAARNKLKSVYSDGTEFWRFPRVVRTGWILPRSADEHKIITDNPDAPHGEDEETNYEEAVIEDVYPFILPRILKVENVKNQIESVATLEVYFGVYGPVAYDKKGVKIEDGTGYRDLWNLIEATRQAFFEHHTIAKRYQIIEDIFEAEMIEEQIYPYWEGKCITKWNVMFPMPRKSQDFF